MAAEVTNELIFNLLKQMQGQIFALQADMGEVKQGLGILESQYASISNRIDRIDEGVTRIERRLDLVDG